MPWCSPSATTASRRSRDISNKNEDKNNKSHHQRQSTTNNDQMWLIAVAMVFFAIGMLCAPPPPSSLTPSNHHHEEYYSTPTEGRTNVAAFASPTTTDNGHDGTEVPNDPHETRDASETFRRLLLLPQLWISSSRGRNRATQGDADASDVLENDIRQQFLESCLSTGSVTPQQSQTDRRWLLVPLSNHHARVETPFSSSNNNDAPPQQSHHEMIQLLHQLAYAMKVALATARELVLVVMDDGSEDGVMWWNRETCATSNRTSALLLSLAGVPFPAQLWCQWKDQFPILSCPIKGNGSTRTTATNTTSIPWSASLQGILNPSVSTAVGSDFFNLEFYGPQPVALLGPTTVARSKKSWMLDSVPEWDRYYGQHWVQSNVITFLWDQLVVPALFPIPGAASDNTIATTTTANTVTDTAGDALPPDHPYVAIIIDDSIQTTLQQTFGRNFTKTHDWTRFLDIANHIRNLVLSSNTNSGHSSKDDPASRRVNRHEKDNIPRQGLNEETSMGLVPNTIYLVLVVGNESHQSHWPPWMTNSSTRPKTVNHQGTDWVIHNVWIPAKSSAILQRLDKQDSWNVSNYIILTERILRRADYLIGSFQSPLFGVATELNAGTMTKTASARHLGASRHWSVDLEWYPYP